MEFIDFIYGRQRKKECSAFYGNRNKLCLRIYPNTKIMLSKNYVYATLSYDNYVAKRHHRSYSTSLFMQAARFFSSHTKLTIY